LATDWFLISDVRTIVLVVLWACGWISEFNGEAALPFRIQIVERDSGWPVPLVQLETVHHANFISDNAGVIAIDLPELMGRATWFQVEGHGYEVPKDGFGSRGVRLVPTPGQRITVHVNRTILAQRLGRITGAGLFAESQKLGEQKSWREPGIMGCDSVQTVLHKGLLFWFWGDTTIPRYPLGIFDGTGATTPRLPLTQFRPPIQLRYDYFSDSEGRPRAVAKMAGTGPTWLTGCADLPDKTGHSHLVATYLKIRGHLEAYERGLCEWNDKLESFRHLKTIWRKDGGTNSDMAPEGHSIIWKDPQGTRWALFGNPFPALRCPATFEAWQDRASWEKLPPIAPLRSKKDGKPVVAHSGSIAWHPWNKRWICVFMEKFGEPSPFGEVWYAESDSPMGPWGKATKIVSHNNYTFYNPMIHSEWLSEKSPEVIFEGTYSAEFANHAALTPRYDYNQILYGLDVRTVETIHLGSMTLRPLTRLK
jgi:hypothetical protein